MAGTDYLSKRDVTPEDLIKELHDLIIVIKRFSNVGQIFLCEIPQRFDHHNINTKASLFNELLAESFLDAEIFLTVVDTVQPYIKFYYEDGLHLSNLGTSKLCGIIEGVPKNLPYSGEQYIVVSLFSFVFFRLSDKTRNKCCNDSFIQIYN